MRLKPIYSLGNKMVEKVHIKTRHKGTVLRHEEDKLWIRERIRDQD